MPLIPAGGDPPRPEAVDAGGRALGAGRVVALPTDTVYGLAGLVGRPEAMAEIFELKGRPEALALPVLVAGLDQAASLGIVTSTASILAGSFWPGGLTLVVPAAPGVSLDLGGPGGTVALRCPAHPLPLELCRRVGPVAATSANRHGEPPLASAPAVAAAFPGLLVLDGGACGGVASTVVDCTGERPALLRAGAVDWARIEAVAAGG
ncbi:MAG TPA: L-threonylcarbamoyladenylate synthase [Acidimicrobiales bacterium]|nr:L-threonylcarbamoyladenylate synthase [Acidimicrobiales bacterium]